jgi:hypothetical protein
MRRMLAPGTPLLLALSLGGCVYYNAMWSAERHAKGARHLEQRGQASEARSQWALAAAKAEGVALRHPRSRWADDALTLQAEGLARSGACDEAATVIARVRKEVGEAGLRERTDLAAAQCAIAAGRLTQAESSLAMPLASKDAGRRSRAELLAGQAAALRRDFDAAVEHFARSRETAAAPARVRALLAAGRPADARAALEALGSGAQFQAERADLLAQLAALGGADEASAALDRILARAGSRMLFQEQSRLLIADADRRLAHGHLDEAGARYRRASLIAPAGTAEAGTAQVGVQRVRLARATQRADLTDIVAELSRLTREPGAGTAKQWHDLAVQTTITGESPGVRFRIAELARDSLNAPALAGQLFLELAAGDTASLYAPKALLAALALLPDRRDSIAGILDTRYATSPYTRAFHGEASVAYAVAEDSLARELGVQVARSAAPAPGARVDGPVPGPRGPRLEPAETGAAARSPRTQPRPGVRPPPPPPVRERP